MTVFADVVIVGGGIMGCSAAFHVARRKGQRVIVVEKGAICSGQTKRSGALIRSIYPTDSESRLATQSLATFQNWKESVGGSCGFVKTGVAWVAGPDANSVELSRQAETARNLGANVVSLSADELRQVQPGLEAQDVGLAVYEAEAGYADPVATTQGFAARARDLGVSFRTGTFVKSILVDHGRVHAVDTTMGPIETLTVIVAAGPWSDRLLKPLGAQIGIQSVRTELAFFDRPPELRAGHSAVIDRITGIHFRPHTFGLTMVGFTSPPRDEVSSPDQFDETLAASSIAELHKRMALRLPAMTNAKYVRGHAGIYDYSPDAKPVIGRVPGIHGLIVAAGFSGSGFAFAPAVGQCLCELAADGESRTLDLQPFRPERFASRS